MATIRLKTPEFGEEYPIELVDDVELYSINNPCEHVYTKNDTPFIKKAIIAYNEGRYNCVIICYDCLKKELNTQKQHT